MDISSSLPVEPEPVPDRRSAIGRIVQQAGQVIQKVALVIYPDGAPDLSPGEGHLRASIAPAEFIDIPDYPPDSIKL